MIVGDDGSIRGDDYAGSEALLAFGLRLLGAELLAKELPKHRVVKKGHHLRSGLHNFRAVNINHRREGGLQHGGKTVREVPEWNGSRIARQPDGELGCAEDIPARPVF